MKEILEQNNGLFLTFEMLAEMENALVKVFASGATVIIATLARPCGQILCKEIIAKISDLEEAFNSFSEWMRERNWAELSFSNINFKNGNGKIIIEKSLATKIKKKTNKTSCYFLTNFIVGFLSELFNKKITVVEKKCARAGNEICEFEFHPQSSHKGR